MGDTASVQSAQVMIVASTLLVQLFLSSAALLGLFVLRGVLIARDPWDPINRRFIFGVQVTMLLFVGRILIITTGIEAFRILVLTASSRDGKTLACLGGLLLCFCPS